MREVEVKEGKRREAVEKSFKSIGMNVKIEEARKIEGNEESVRNDFGKIGE